MATPGWPQNLAMPDSLVAAIRGAAAGQSRRDIVPIDGRLLLITSEPAKFTEAEVIGVVTFGFVLDDRVAQDLARITRAEINLVTGNRLAGSSLSPNEQKQIAAMVAAGNLASADAISSEIRQIGDRQFIGGAFPLFPDRATQAGHLVLLQDWAPTQKFLDELRMSLVLAGIGGFVIALAGGLLFSRRMSQPLMDIAAAARDIAAGDWSRIVPGRGSAEATTMAMAFNDMTRSLRSQAERLNASYRRFATVTQSARDAIISTDELLNITFWNRSAESTFGYTEQEVLGRPMVNLIGESDRAAWKAALPSPATDEVTFGHIIEVTGMRKDGGRFPCEFSLAVLHSAEGTAFTAVVRDVMERKQSQDQLKQRDEQLRQAQKMEAIGRLAGGVAHDFNNLLMAIRGYAEMIAQNLPSGDERRSDAEEILKGLGSRGGTHAPAAGVQPARSDHAAGGGARPARADDAGDAAAADRCRHSDGDRDLAGPDTGARRQHAARADSREPRHQRARRHAQAAERLRSSFATSSSTRLASRRTPGCSLATTSKCP